MKSRLIFLLPLLVLLLWHAERAEEARTAVIAVGADIDSFNEYVATSTFAIDLADQLYLNLMEERPGTSQALPEFDPRLARSWRIAEDGLSVAFHLRDDVRWSDGHPTMAQDVRFTWQAQTDPTLAWPDADLKGNIAHVTVDGPHTVTFVLKRRSPYALLEINEGHILPKHALEKIPLQMWRQTDFSKGLVTNGPFRLAVWKPGQAIQLEGNPHYYEPGLPRLERVIFRVVTDPMVRLSQIFTGESDVLESVPPESVDRVASDSSLALVRFDQRMYTYLCWNGRQALFADPSVRRALTMALDREEMLAVLAKGMGRPSAGPIVSSLWAANRSLRSLPFDAAGSRRLLKEAGWEDRDKDGIIEKQGRPFRFDLEFNRGNSLREAIALRAAAQLAEVGVRASPRAVEWVAFQRKHRDGDFDSFVASRIVSTRVNLESFITGAAQNYSGYANPELDSLARRAAASATLEEARPLWIQAQEIIARDLPVTFLFEQDRLYAVRRGIQDIQSGPLGLFGGLRRWRVESPPAGEPIRSD